jgi:hypothetical protein
MLWVGRLGPSRTVRAFRQKFTLEDAFLEDAHFLTDPNTEGTRLPMGLSQHGRIHGAEQAPYTIGSLACCPTTKIVFNDLERGRNPLSFCKRTIEEYQTLVEAGC